MSQPLPEDDAIAAAHPTRTGRHDLYEEAMRLVGARHSKGALVELVNYYLHLYDGAGKAHQHHLDEANDLIAAAERHGRQAGWAACMEEAADLADDEGHFACAMNIRNLRPPAGDGGERGGLGKEPLCQRVGCGHDEEAHHLGHCYVPDCECEAWGADPSQGSGT